ncbi:MAG: hypothetical protein H0U65_08860 [Rubrobacter sp.]|nr:hypothetical protein [Rubrobacter sp.]
MARPVSGHYLIVRRDFGGLELPHLSLGGREGVLPIFSSEKAAERFLASRLPGDGWRVRGFSRGEVISLLFAFGEGVRWMAPDPESPAREGGGPRPMSRGAFIEFLAG